ncbi:DciA family protein [Aquabacterium sp.]|uniref:DciA family protein n=1 Tax=Aquabacterium sp. TaxID=1872578 RepID=UPI002E312D7E|nr:DciA family protein [Aquabacterium sp.]HEX5313010.1 DciA family protein [Aquabacterium sp.]
MFQRPSSFKPLVPDVPSVTRALEQSETMVTLMQRLQASQACLAVAKACLPPALAAYIKSGSIDHEGWTLLAPNAAVSAKLRQLQPRILEALAKKGLKVNAIRVKVQSYESL